MRYILYLRNLPASSETIELVFMQDKRAPTKAVVEETLRLKKEKGLKKNNFSVEKVREVFWVRNFLPGNNSRFK